MKKGKMFIIVSAAIFAVFVGTANAAPGNNHHGMTPHHHTHHVVMPGHSPAHIRPGEHNHIVYVNSHPRLRHHHHHRHTDAGDIIIATAILVSALM